MVPQGGTTDGVGGARPLVIFVDDEPSVLSSLERLLRREPYDVLTTTDPRRALEWVGRNHVSFLVSDQRMPIMTGIQLIQEVRKRSPSTDCAILMGYMADSFRLEAAQTGLPRFIAKPWNDEALKRTIWQVLEERQRKGTRADKEPPADGRP
jgi:DNA-binding NtrC family response regulator